MPLIRGPFWDQQDLPGHVYASVESLMLEYETNPDAIPPLLPEPFKPGITPYSRHLSTNLTNRIVFYIIFEYKPLYQYLFNRGNLARNQPQRLLGIVC